MAGKAKARTMVVQLISTAQTGFAYTTSRLRVGRKLKMMKYDPVAKKHCVFVESKKTKK